MSLLEPAWRGADYLAQLEGATLLGVYKISAIITIVTVALAALTMSGRAQGPSEGVSGASPATRAQIPAKRKRGTPLPRIRRLVTATPIAEWLTIAARRMSRSETSRRAE